jgi:hypothetical protein
MALVLGVRPYNPTIPATLSRNSEPSQTPALAAGVCFPFDDGRADRWAGTPEQWRISPRRNQWAGLRRAGTRQLHWRPPRSWKRPRPRSSLNSHWWVGDIKRPCLPVVQVARSTCIPTSRGQQMPKPQLTAYSLSLPQYETASDGSLTNEVPMPRGKVLGTGEANVSRSALRTSRSGDCHEYAQMYQV